MSSSLLLVVLWRFGLSWSIFSLDIFPFEQFFWGFTGSLFQVTIH